MFFFLSGSIFDEEYASIKGAFRYAMEQHNVRNLNRELQVYVDIINTRDAFKIARLSEYITNYIYILNT